MGETLIINVHQAKTQFSRLLEQAHQGQEIILAKAGKPYARMVPLVSDVARPRQPGQLKWLALDADAVLAPLSGGELDAWEQSPVEPA
jgi:prevent-host-death family protein